MVHGKVYLVGAGPGDPKLLTLRAAELLAKADIVIYDRLVGTSILKLAPKTAKKIYVGKRTGKHEVPQDKINELLVTAASEGKTIVRLKGGDPFLFGRGGEEAETLVENHISFEMVPGVTSAIATPEYAGIPLTHRDYASAVAVVTGHRAGDSGRPVRWSDLALAVDTIVILMGMESLEAIVKKLVEGGLDPNRPVAIVEQGTTRNQRSYIGKLSTIVDEAKQNNVKPPAVIVIGEVAELGQETGMVQKDHSLKGRTIVVTRPREQAQETIKAIEAHGGKPYLFPTIEIQAPRDPSKAKTFFEALAQKKVDYVILMSVNGVQYLLNAAESLGIMDEVKRNLGGVVMMAVGPKTAQELEKNGIRVDVVPEKYTSEGILQYFQQHHVKGKAIYVPRTSEAPPELGANLREMGNHVEEVYVYQSQLPSGSERAANFVKDLTDNKVNAILFTSSLGVRNFFEMLERVILRTKLKNLIQEKTVVVAIGPTTAKTLTETGVKVNVMPENHTLDETLKALVRYWNADGS